MPYVVVVHGKSFAVVWNYDLWIKSNDIVYRIDYVRMAIFAVKIWILVDMLGFVFIFVFHLVEHVETYIFQYSIQ